MEHLKETVTKSEQEQLARFIAEQNSLIASRKLIGEFLLFITCQSLGSALAVLLFQYTLKVWVISWLCYLIGLAPCLEDLSSISFKQRDNGGWEIGIMRSPGKFLFKLVFSIGFTYVGIQEVRQAINTTYNGLNAVLSEVRAYETPATRHYSFPVDSTVILMACVLVGLFLLLRGKLPER